MLKFSIKKRLYLSIIFLFAIVLLVWTLFYSSITSLINNNTKTQLDNTANQIMNELASEFERMEQLVFSLAQNTLLKDFISEENVDKYFNKAKDVNELLTSSISDSGFIKYVVTYNKDGVYYRFKGAPGNSTCARIFNLINKSKTPEHLIIKVGNSKLIGYGSCIYDSSGQKIGAVVIFVDEDTVLNKLYSNNYSEKLNICIAAKNEIIISNKPDILNMNIKEVKKSSQYYTDRQIGITPFDIIVFSDNSYISSLNLYFTVSTVITALILLLAILIFARFLNIEFFSPMFSVMKSVENLNINSKDNSIPYIKSSEFNRLISKLNDMLERIESKNKTIQDTQMMLKNAEVKKQKAIIVSLKKQINAHFTVNTLNIIKILVSKRDLIRAEEMCDGLSMLIRYAHNEDELINVWDEFGVIQSYINIMNIRYDNKIVVNFDLDDRLIDYKIPRMLIQPIIENAIVHGYKDHKLNCIIDISANIVSDKIIVRIRDNGTGLDESDLKEIRRKIDETDEDTDALGGITNIALKNIRHRIVSYYGESCNLNVDNGITSGLEVTIVLGVDVNISEENKSLQK